MPNYLLLVTIDKSIPASEEDRENAPDVEAWWDELNDAGRIVAGDPLKPAAEAKTVRVRGGKVVATDGPFTEVSEIIVGLDIVQCADMEEAVRVAAGHPVAWAGAVEVREFAEMPAKTSALLPDGAGSPRQGDPGAE